MWFWISSPGCLLVRMHSALKTISLALYASLENVKVMLMIIVNFVLGHTK